MSIGPNVLILNAQPRDDVFFWVINLYHGSVKNKIIFQNHRQKQNIALSPAWSEIVWLHCLLAEIGFSQKMPTSLNANNTSAIQIASNPVFHERTEHIEVDCHYFRDAFEEKIITLPHITTDLQVSATFTKSLPRVKRQLFVDKLMMADSPTSI